MTQTIKIGEGNHGPLRPLESDRVCACGHFRREHTLDNATARCVHYALVPDGHRSSAVRYCGCVKFVQAAEATP